MQLRIPYFDLSTDALSGLGSVNAYLETCSVEKELIELIYLRVSEINGCSFCLKKHSKALCEMGVSQEKLDVLSGWKSRSIFSEKEMAALGWAESLTHISVTHAPDEDYQQLTNYFSEKEISDLTFAISNMNALNRLAIAMRQ